MQDIMCDALEHLLKDRCTPDVVRAIEHGQSPAALWERLEGSGFADALVSESQGGAGLALRDAFALLQLCGRHAVPVPLAETMLARALLAEAGVGRPSGCIAFASAAAMAGGAVRCANVSSGRVADWVLVQCPTECLLLPTANAEVAPAVFALDATLAWDRVAVLGGKRVASARQLIELQACAASAQIAGALMDVFTRTLHHANERQQFGRPIGKFQAIQHQLAVLAEHAFAARTAAQIGCQSVGWAPQRLRVALAKSRTSEAALEVAALAHSIHGAIGFTQALDLQLFTRRLHAWRQAAGSEGYWHDVLGQALVYSHHGLALDLLRATCEPT